MTGGRRLQTALVVGFVGLVALAVVVFTAVRGDQDRPGRDADERARDRALTGPHSPAPGRLEGRLLVSRGDRCSVHEIDLRRVAIERGGSARGCELWVSPTGELALSRSATDGSRSATHALLTVGGDPTPAASQPSGLGNARRWRASPVWDPSGTRLALCGPDGATLVIDVDSDETRTLAGCWPTFTPSGNVLSMSDPTLDERTAREPSEPVPSLEVGRPVLSATRQAILEDGQERLGLADVRRALPSSASSLGRILGFASDSTGRLAVTVLYLDGLEVRSALQFWDGTSFAGAVQIPVLLGDRAVTEPTSDAATPTAVQLLRFSPDGDELAITSGTVDPELLLLDPRTGKRVLGSKRQVAFDWSPSGDWLGVATPTEIEIYGPDRSRTPTFVIPVSVSALAWRAR